MWQIDSPLKESFYHKPADKRGVRGRRDYYQKGANFCGIGKSVDIIKESGPTI